MQIDCALHILLCQDQCAKVLVAAATFPEPRQDEGIRPSEWGRRRLGHDRAMRTRKTRQRGILVQDESHGVVTEGARRLGLSKHVAVSVPHPITTDLSTSDYLTT